jgi:hypothetical protein
MSDSTELSEITRLRADLDALREEVRELKASSPHPKGHQSNSVEPSRTSRRNALMVAGAAAVGVVGGSLVKGGSPALAQGDDLVLGTVNSASADTSLYSSASGLEVFAGSGNALQGQSAGSSASVAGQDGGAGTGPAVQGSNTNPSNTSPGVSGSAVGGDGVYGQTSGSASSGVHGVDIDPSGVFGPTGGVLGEGLLTPGVVGLSGSADGVVGILGGPSGILVNPAAVTGDSNTDAGVQGASTAGTGVSGTTSKDGAAGVQGADTSTGGGFGAKVQSNNGTALVASGGKGGAITANGATNATVPTVTADSSTQQPAMQLSGEPVPTGPTVKVAGNGDALLLQGSLTSNQCGSVTLMDTSINYFNVPGGIAENGVVIWSIQGENPGDKVEVSVYPVSSTGSIGFQVDHLPKIGFVKIGFVVVNQPQS